MKTLVLGSTGMLGHQVMEKLRFSGLEVIGTSRRNTADDSGLVKFDVEKDSLSELFDKHPDVNFVVNAIGIIKPYIHDDVSTEVVRATKINSLFPHELASICEQKGINVIQIATDCVYSGSVGNYDEYASHDATDVYGKTKSIGEVNSPNVMHLRCSIIGREVGRSTSLVEWVVGQEPNATISGFQNHRWNGVTTNAFGRLCAGIINNNFFVPGVHHVIPANIVDKYILVSEIALRGNRQDIRVNKTDAQTVIDRTISTSNSELNERLWVNAGYSEMPTVEEMVSEMFKD